MLRRGGELVAKKRIANRRKKKGTKKNKPDRTPLKGKNRNDLSPMDKHPFGCQSCEKGEKRR